MLTRAKVALKAPDASRRLSHFVLAKLLYSAPGAVRRSIFAGIQYHCPVCETDLSRFLILHRSYHLWCPVCRSLQRHRLLWLFLVKTQIISQGRPRRLLHFAPEPCLTHRFAGIPHLDYVTADLSDPFAMLTMDITQITFPDNAFDVILCSHVLEHVSDDHGALRELYRVLRPAGQAVILVPITAAVTREDPSVTDPIEREKLFGQYDHVRRYGFDFGQRLKEAGFNTSTISAEEIAKPDEIVRMGLTEREVIFLARKE